MFNRNFWNLEQEQLSGMPPGNRVIYKANPSLPSLTLKRDASATTPCHTRHPPPPASPSPTVLTVCGILKSLFTSALPRHKFITKF